MGNSTRVIIIIIKTMGDKNGKNTKQWKRQELKRSGENMKEKGDSPNKTDIHLGDSLRYKELLKWRNSPAFSTLTR